MKRSRSITFGIVALLALAGMPAISGASSHAAPLAARKGLTLTTTARAVHTGVHAGARPHHARAHRGHHTRTELRAAATRHGLSRHPGSAPVAPRPRPAHSHAALPHAATKLHRNLPRGGAPYALGQASLSLGLWTDGGEMPACQNDLISDPLSGLLRGRSPPRGIPLIAISTPCPARPAALLACAPADSFRDRRSPLALQVSSSLDPSRVEARPTSGASARGSMPTTVRFRREPRCLVAGSADLSCRAFPRGTVASPITPDRASEGRAAGSLLPSWRWFT